MMLLKYLYYVHLNYMSVTEVCKTQLMTLKVELEDTAENQTIKHIYC